MKTVKIFVVNGSIFTEIIHETKDIEKQLLDPNASYEKIVALKMDLPKIKRSRRRQVQEQISFLKGGNDGQSGSDNGVGESVSGQE